MTGKKPMQPRYVTGILTGIVLLVSGCNRDPANNRVLSRVSSPDKRVEVLITEVPAGATVSTPFEVFLVNSGERPTQQDMILKVDRAEQPRVEWKGADLLAISCIGGRVWYFRNFATVKTAEAKIVNVGVSLGCGERGYTSPQR